MNWKTATAGALIGAAAIAGCGSAAATHHAPPAHPTAAASTSAPIAGSKCTQLVAWNDSGGGKAQDNAIASDLGTLANDASNQNLAAMSADGKTMADEAALAMLNTPPIAGGSYRLAMADLMHAGDDAQAGNLAGASAQMNAGTRLINKVTAAIRAQCG